MKYLYVDLGEEITPNAPKPRVKPVQVNCFVDSDHAVDRSTRISQTWIVLYCNSAAILYYSKMRNMVECSSFGAEFIESQILTELIVSLRYTLRMIGVPIEGAANFFCDNKYV